MSTDDHHWPRSGDHRNWVASPHTNTGNCWKKARACKTDGCRPGDLCDVCHKHSSPRGDCDECDACEACEGAEE